ncbi:MAG: 30S ribosomal protein S6--L-glutamate ligase, partial [Candidatus Pacebacteria bacterium]|nr:30S ribosomal protein S6--L-glutamate ligase [Candidatus Paceibacterota bacterium]
NQGDYRFFIIGKKLIAAMKRTRQDPNSFLNNISQGGRGEVYNATKKEEELAILAAQSLGYEIAGVDLIKDKGKMKIMEVNRSPGYSGLMKLTKINIPLEIMRYLKSLAFN